MNMQRKNVALGDVTAVLENLTNALDDASTVVEAGEGEAFAYEAEINAARALLEDLRLAGEAGIAPLDAAAAARRQAFEHNKTAYRNHQILTLQHSAGWTAEIFHDNGKFSKVTPRANGSAAAVAAAQRIIDGEDASFPCACGCESKRRRALIPAVRCIGFERLHDPYVMAHRRPEELADGRLAELFAEWRAGGRQAPDDGDEETEEFENFLRYLESEKGFVYLTVSDAMYDFTPIYKQTAVEAAQCAPARKTMREQNKTNDKDNEEKKR